MKGSEIQAAIIDLLVWDGYLVLRPNGGGMKTEDGRYIIFIRWSALGFADGNPKGVADVLAFAPGDGRRLAIEVKGDGDTLKPDQELFLEAWEQAGGVSIVAKAVEDVQPYLMRSRVQ